MMPNECPLIAVRPPAAAARRPRGRWSPERVAEVADALGRRQRELPVWVLAEAAEAAEDDARDAVLGTSAVYAAAEHALVAERLPALLGLPAPRSVVQLGACGRAGTRPLLDALVARGTLERLVVADVSAGLARRDVSAALALHPALAAAAVAAD